MPTDQEEIRRLLQKNDILQKIFDSIQDGILLVDDRKCISYANRSAENLLGIPREDLLGNNVEELPVSMHFQGGEEMPKESRPFSVAFGPNPLGKAQQAILKRQDGSTMPVLFNIQTGSEDITVAILTDSRELMRRQLQADEHYQLLAHDMRIPLTVILGHSEILQTSPMNVDKDESVNAIRIAGEQLKDMTEEISDRLELESEHFNLKKKTIQLENIILESVSQFTSEKTSQHIETQIPSLPPVQGDSYRLKRVFNNLISNAIKYSPEGSTISVSAWETSKTLMVKISDQGRGIDSRDLHFIFDPFFITSVGKEKGGIGLGLYIARLIMEAHGGGVYVSSSEEGTSFAIFLPKEEELS